MLLLRCSFLFLATITITIARAQNFNSKQCLDSKFEIEIKNEGQLFGLIKNNLRIKKEACLLNISFKKILETTWQVDLCREPIHIKVTSKGSQEVYKKKGKCPRGGEYCDQKAALLAQIQDYGLIYAKGERELLTTPHGQTYCSYILLKKYLNEGKLFSKYQNPENIFEEKMEKTQTCPVPEMQPVQKLESENEVNEREKALDVSNSIPTDQARPEGGTSAEGEF